MKSGVVLGFITLLCLTGSGCFRSEARTDVAIIPEVRIERPANGTETFASSTEIVGSSNMPEVWVGGNRHLVVDNVFSVPIELHPGNNQISVFAENGYTTTSLMLTIIRTDPDPSKP